MQYWLKNTDGQGDDNGCWMIFVSGELATLQYIACALCTDAFNTQQFGGHRMLLEAGLSRELGL